MQQHLRALRTTLLSCAGRGIGHRRGSSSVRVAFRGPSGAWFLLVGSGSVALLGMTGIRDFASDCRMSSLAVGSSVVALLFRGGQAQRSGRRRFAAAGLHPQL